MTTKYLDSSGLSYLWGKLKDYFQPKLVSGTNIKTVNNTSLLGSGDISIGGGSGTSTPTADEVAEFDSTAHMNSTDMTSAEVTDFVNDLSLSKFSVDINGNKCIFNFVAGMTWQDFVDSEFNKSTADPSANDFTINENYVYITSLSGSSVIYLAWLDPMWPRDARPENLIVPYHTYVTSYSS